LKPGVSDWEGINFRLRKTSVNVDDNFVKHSCQLVRCARGNLGRPAQFLSPSVLKTARRPSDSLGCQQPRIRECVKPDTLFRGRANLPNVYRMAVVC
jgi:hypothetical protein